MKSHQKITLYFTRILYRGILPKKTGFCKVKKKNTFIELKCRQSQWSLDMIDLGFFFSQKIVILSVGRIKLHKKSNIK